MTCGATSTGQLHRGATAAQVLSAGTDAHRAIATLCCLRCESSYRKRRVSDVNIRRPDPQALKEIGDVGQQPARASRPGGVSAAQPLLLELAATTVMPEGKRTRSEVLITGHLRCSLAAAAQIRDAIDRALAMPAQP